MKKLLSIVLSIAIIASVAFCFSLDTYAVENRIEDTDTYYSFNSSNGTLTISGTGDMYNYVSWNSNIPWYDYYDKITNIVIEEGITSIGMYSFNYTNAVSVSLPSTLVSINGHSFSNAPKIKSVDVPFGVRTIANFAFENDIGIEEVSLPNTLVSIGTKAFNHCVSLKEITIPYSVKSIGMYAFQTCSKLEKVEFESLSSGITLLNYAFIGCDMLKELSVPMNAVCNTGFFGFNNSKGKYSDVKMKVFYDSNAYYYADSNGFNYTFIDEIPMECGVNYENKFVLENKNKEILYTFVPDSDGEYCFYSKGDIDIKARVELNGNTIAQNEDISPANRNFCIKLDCKAGQKYYLIVESSNYTGDYTVYALPTDIEEFSVKGSISLYASSGVLNGDKMMYSLDNDMLIGDLFTVKFTNGLVHRFYYKDDYYDATQIRIASPVSLKCGDDSAFVYIGDKASSIATFVNHSYVSSNVAPTPDEDGYTLHKCINCDDSYKDEYYKADKQIYILSGKCVLSENKYGYHSEDLPYSSATIRVGNREYSVNPDGTWMIRTFDSCNIVFDNHYGMNVTIRYNVDKDNPEEYYGVVSLDGYDFNNDGFVNARDYVIFQKEKKSSLCDDYWQFAENFLTTH